ncbi:MAG: response regulator transcription factor [Cyclobacteriaceae bacterium]|nr:response regulator transcription factor [Cyclobacteriaceae bacterium]
MRVLIIEDEPLAATRLKSLLTKLDTSMTMVDVLDSVKASVNWFNTYQPPQLIFMDIQLADGSSFEIFEKVTVKAPIIFTTAYDEYAIKAFKVNSIDYLLKPIDEDSLIKALDKFRSLNEVQTIQQTILAQIGSTMQQLTQRYKERFVIKVGDHLKFIDVGDIQYFYSEEKITFCITNDKRKHILDFTLDQLDELVDPSKFSRINRKYIVSINSIIDVISHTNSRLKLILKASDDNDVIVARERVQSFKNWLDR